MIGINTDLRTISEKVLFLSVSIFAIYTMCFQYAFFEIAGFLPFLAVLIMGTSVFVANDDLFSYKRLLPVGLFILVAYISGLLYSDNRSFFLKYLNTILRYAIPMLGIYIYIGTDRSKLKNFAYVLSFVGALTALSTFFAGRITNTGALTVGSLNSNLLSSYIMVGLIGTSYVVLNETKKKLFLVDAFIIIVDILGILNAASRRGVIVLAFMLAYMFLVFFQIKIGSNSWARFTMIVLGAISLAFLVVSFEDLFGESLFFKRLTGFETGGDSIRKRLQHLALEFFKSSPILGKGLGCVEYAAGLYSHSYYYELLATTGISGFLLSVGLFARNFITLYRASMPNSRNRKEYRIEYRMLAFGIISILICGVAVVMIYDMYFYMMIGFYAGALHILDYEKQIKETEERIKMYAAFRKQAQRK